MALDRRAVLAGALLSSVPAAAIASLSEEEALLRDEEKAVEKLDSAIKGDLLDEKKIQIEIKKQSEALAKATQADDKTRWRRCRPILLSLRRGMLRTSKLSRS